MALSPDRSGPPLTATLSCGVRTFLSPPEAESDRLIHFSPIRLQNSLQTNDTQGMTSVYTLRKPCVKEEPTSC